MTINHNNIDQWLFNYYEGNLNPSETKALERFLSQNPEYYEDAQAWKNSFVEESIPAFDASSLIKSHASTNERKRYALALAALLLIGSSSAFYFISNSQETYNTNAASNTRQNSFINPTAKNIHLNQTHSTSQSLNSPILQPASLVESVTIEKESKKDNSLTQNSNTQSKKIAPVQNTMATNALLYSNTNKNILKQTALKNTAENTKNQSNNTNSSNTPETQNTVIEPTNGNLLQNEALNSPEKTQTITNTNTYNSESVNTSQNAIDSNVEMLNLAIASEEVINLSTSETESGQNMYNMNGLSDLNPDALLKSSDLPNLSKTEVENEKNKVDLSAPKGVRFGNLRNVVLLNVNNFNFQTNASFIVQHFSTDGYLGANYLNTTTRTQHQVSTIAGISHNFRKAHFSINAFGTYTKNAFFTSQSANLQSALQVKLDRNHFIIPSIGVNFTQYTFTAPSLLSSAENPNYFFSQLSKLQEVSEVKNINHANLNLGVLYHHKKFFMALSANGLLQPKFNYINNDKMSFAKLPARVNFVAGTDFISKNRPELSLSPQIVIDVYDMVANASAGAVVKYKNFKTGAAVSTSGSINGYFGFSQKMVNLQYRFVLEKTNSPYNFSTGHYLSTSFNLKGLGKKRKAILDEEK